LLNGSVEYSRKPLVVPMSVSMYFAPEPETHTDSQHAMVLVERDEVHGCHSASPQLSRGSGKG
jgi:hypothetical protein